MKRILFITPGPIFKIWDEFKYKKLSEHFSGTIITTSPEKEILKIEKIANFDFVCLKYNFTLNIITSLHFLYFLIFHAIKLKLNNKNYDLIVTYDPLKTGLLGVLISKILRTKFAPEVNGVYTSYANYIDGNNKYILNIKKKLYPIIEKFVLKHADVIKVLFEEQLDYFRGSIQNLKIKAFPDFVNIDNFISLPINNENKEILFIGYPFNLKGVDILIQAFKKLSSKHPEWKLKILGWFEPQIDLLMQHMDGHDKIVYHPPVENFEIPGHMESCSIFILPSRTEAMGRVLVEAMAAGKARIGSNVDGIPTVIRDGIDGLLFTSGDTDDLIRKMDQLMSDSEFRNHLGQEGRKRALGEFSSDTYFKNLINFYKESA